MKAIKCLSARVLCLVVAGVMCLSAIPMFGGVTPVNYASPLAVSSEGYTHQSYSGEFAETDSPTNVGVRVENVETDWGLFGLDKGDYVGKTFSQLKWGSQAITVHARYFDLYVNYWYYNNTPVAGRPFANGWGNFYELRNDSYVGIWEYYSNARTSFSGSNDVWNATVRFTVLKFEPYIKVDVWLKYLNLSQPIKKLDVKPCYHEGGTDYTAGTDANRRMSYRVANDGSWAVGQVSHGLSTSGNVQCAMGQFTQNRTQHDLSEYWHMSSVIIIGQDLADLEEKAERLGDEWFTEYARTDRNIVIAFNDDRFDCIRFFPDTGYSVVPSAEYETVIESGVATSRVFAANPLLSYSKIPVITDIDDSYYGYGVNEHWDWYYNQSEAYGVGTTFPTEWAYVLPSYMSSLLNLSEKREGTLYEMGEHGWNHTELYTYQDFDYQKGIWELSEARWEANSSYELLSQAFPGNAWSYVTFEAMAEGGAANLRLSVLGNEYIAPYDFEYGGDTVFLAGFTELLTHSTSLAGGLEQYGNAYGYIFHQGHITDFDTDPERTAVLAYWQYLENNTDTFNSVTHAQWSDLWHHRIQCYELDGRYRVDLSNATADHRLQLGPIEGRLSFVWDVTADAMVTTESFGSSESVFYGLKGHVYESVMEVVFDSPANGTGNLSVWDPEASMNGERVAVWSLSLDSVPHCVYYVSGLDSLVGYRVYQDGEEIFRQHSGYSSISFTATGGVEFVVEVWDPYQIWEDAATMVFPAAIGIGLAAVIASAVISRAWRG